MTKYITKNINGTKFFNSQQIRNSKGLNKKTLLAKMQVIDIEKFMRGLESKGFENYECEYIHKLERSI